MRGKRILAAALACVALLATQARAQDRSQTLADIRQELTVLHVEIQKLAGELNTTGAPLVETGNGTVEDRVAGLEAEVTRLTAKTEALELRVNSIVKDGTNRIGDLEFRLVELEGGDVSKLGETTTLGGGDLPPGPALPTPASNGTDMTGTDTTGGGQLAVAEQADYDAALSAFKGASWAEAAQRFGQFAEAYPGGPLTPEALFYKGEALAQQGQTSEAARAYLGAFSAAPEGTRAPEALLKLGQKLGELGQTNEACVTLGEVANRFPASASVGPASQAKAALGCP